MRSHILDIGRFYGPNIIDAYTRGDSAGGACRAAWRLLRQALRATLGSTGQALAIPLV